MVTNLKEVEQGNTQTMKFARPVDDKSPKISQGFSSSHTGIDYAYGEGTALFASQSGTVVQAKTSEKRQWLANTDSDPFKPATGKRPLKTEDYGNYIKIQHTEGFSTLYAHLKYMANTVRIGDRVEIGQYISQIGTTGNSSGNHTHFELRLHDKTVNPADHIDTSLSPYFYKAEGGDSVDEVLKQRADSFIAVCTELDSEATKDSALAKIKAFKKQIEELEEANRIKEREINQTKVELVELKGKLKISETRLEELEHLVSEQKIEIKEAQELNKQAFEKIEELEKKAPATDESIVNLIGKIIVKLLRK